MGKFTPESLIDYPAIQSIIVNMAARACLHEGTAPLFPPQDTARFRFYRPIWFSRRIAADMALSVVVSPGRRLLPIILRSMHGMEAADG